MKQRIREPQNVGQQDRLTSLAYLSVVILVALLVGVPLLLVAILALFLDGVAWPAIAGLVTIALGLVLGLIAYRWLPKIKREVEAPRRINKVFVSYRTAEHGRYAHRLVEALHDAGIDTVFFRSGEVNIDPDQPHTAFRALGLFQMGGLDADLQRGLMESVAMVYFVPLTERKLGPWQVMKDTVDGLMAWLMFQSGLTVTFWHWAWYAIFYGRALVPAIRMFDLASWQAWELAIAHQLDLPILRVIVDGDPSQLDGESIQCQSDSLESDYRTKVVPELKEASRTALRLGGPLLMMGLVAVISTVLIVVIIAVVIVTVLALALYLIGRTLG